MRCSIAAKKKARYYRWARRVVCILPDTDSPIGERLMVPRWALQDLPDNVLKHYPPLPKPWRKLIQESINERTEANN